MILNLLLQTDPNTLHPGYRSSDDVSKIFLSANFLSIIDWIISVSLLVGACVMLYEVIVNKKAKDSLIGFITSIIIWKAIMLWAKGGLFT